MHYFYLIVAAAMMLIVLGVSFLFSKKYSAGRLQFHRVAGIALAFLAALRYLGGTTSLGGGEGSLWGNFLISGTIGLNQYSPFGPHGSSLAFLAVITIWLTVAAMLLLLIYPFFAKKLPLLSTVVKLFGTLTYILALLTIPVVNQAMDGAEIASSFYWRHGLYATEIGIGLGISLSTLLLDGFRRSELQKLPQAILAFLGFVFSSMPVYALCALFGKGPEGVYIDNLGFYHRIVLYLSILLPVAIHFLFRRFTHEGRRCALLVLSLGVCITYCIRYDFGSFTHIPDWPLHLCNTALFLVPLCLMFRMERLYYFTLFINVLGSLFAMIIPDFAVCLAFEPVSVEFWLNHYYALFMPVLLLSLGMYQRPRFKQFLYSVVAFAVYYVIVVFLNAWLDTDFFFTNSDHVAEIAGQWAEDLFDFTLSFSIGDAVFTFHLIYQILYFIAYILLTLVVWFVLEQCFEVSDLYSEIRSRKKKIRADMLALEVRLAGRSIKEPVNMDGKNKLILKNFSKRYATSKVFAVQDACLEIEGGQIFGFLGPNGAGKSTIIKSVVGIQGITSGSIEVCGYDVATQPIGAKSETGFVPDHYALYENLTGREYVNYIADLYGVSKKDRTARIDEYVERFCLEHAFDNQIKTYSHGMKQKITIMSALVHNPRLWILDEPLTGLDPESIRQVKECMFQHAKAGNIVFFSSHIIDVVEKICDRIAIIKKGTILCTHTVKEIEEMGFQLEDFYLRAIETGRDPAKERA